MTQHPIFCRIKSPYIAAVLALTTSTPLFSAEPGELGARIVGSDEAPAVLNIVPWQDRELDTLPDKKITSFKSVLDDALQPADKAAVLREVEYRDALKPSTQKQNSTMR